MISADTDHLRETLISRRPVYDGKLITVFEDEIRYPSARTGLRVIVEHPGAVCVIPVTAAGRIVLVRQWRHAAGRALWELPAGTRDGDEDPRRCAERELSEETGYTAKLWRDLGSMLNAPGYSTERMFFFEARELTGGATHPDTDELLDVAEFDTAGIRELLGGDDLDMKTVTGLALAGIKIHG